MKNGLKNAIRVEIQCRAERHKTIPPEFLGEPAWDILLDLAISQLYGKRVQITAAGLTAGLAPTTSLRWVCRLEERGLIRRLPDEDDGRRTWLGLQPETMEKLAACFGYEWRGDREPIPTGTIATLDAETRGMFFGEPDETDPRAQEASSFIADNDRSRTGVVLLRRATDWINQDYDERLSFAAQALYVHGYLSPHEYRRIETQLREDADKAREEKVKARTKAFWR